jgi:hypothetical protein
VAVTFLVVLLTMSVSSCGTVHPTLDELRSVPGATSEYPNSSQLQSFDQDSSSNLFAKNAAILKSYWCSPVDRSTWSAWFSQQLVAQGWESHHTIVDSSTPDVTQVQEWTRGDRTFDLYALSQSYTQELIQDRNGPTSCVSGYGTTVQ